MNLNALLGKFEGRRVVVLGDLIADVFVYGEISRTSREAPVLVLSQRETQLVPGGAGNAIHNLWALGARPLPVGIVGEDTEGQQLVEYFSKLGIDTSGIRKVASYQTPTKTRILAGTVHSYRQQVVRLDRGSPLQSPQTVETIKKRLTTRLKKSDAVLISDYGYGLVTPELAATAHGTGLPTTLDSRFAIRDYTGMTAATPNEPEVEAALGIKIGNDLEKLERAGRTLLRRFKHEAVLITRGKDGMALFERGRKTLHIPIHGTDEIADVTGAGDTVIATFTLALASGGTAREAAELANCAGGIVVMKHGTRPIQREELAAAIPDIQATRS
jgi:rfaE bifunctional protein kinase chain/domain